MAHKTVTLKQSVFIPAPPAEVYEAYTNPQRHAEFTGAEATGTPRVGEDFTAWDGYIEGEYLELEPEHKIVQSWSTSEWPEGYEPSHLEIVLEPSDGGTKLTLTQTEVPAEQADDYEDGWHTSYWEPMTEYFQK